MTVSNSLIGERRASLRCEGRRARSQYCSQQRAVLSKQSRRVTLSGTETFWKHQVEVFAADYRVVALDQAGHGESGKGRKAWTADGLAGDVEAVVKSLGLKRVILVGHSMGGSVALLAAKRMPGTVVAVIGVDTL